MSNILLIFLAIVLVLFNAFFVAAEFAMVRLRQTRIAVIKKKNGIRGKILAYVHQNLDSHLSACQLGITLASLGLGWVGEPAFAYLMEPLLRFLSVTSIASIKVVSFAVAFTVISFLHIVVGELMPKSLAIRQSESVSLWTAIPLFVFYRVMYPAIWVLNSCSNILLRFFKLDKTHSGEVFYSTAEIKFILSASSLHGEITKDEAEIMEHTLEFADLRISEVMRPEDELVMLDLDLPVDDLLKVMLKHRFSRYPVYDSKTKSILGIIHVKDLFVTSYTKEKIYQLKSVMRPVVKVSHRTPAIEMLRKFRQGMSHLALVYKGKKLVGFVTLDNLLHIILGKIKDEFHKTKDDWVSLENGTFLVKGDCSVYSLEQALDKDIDDNEEGDADTVVDLIVHRIGYFPKLGERVELDEFSAVVKGVENGEIELVEIYPKIEFDK